MSLLDDIKEKLGFEDKRPLHVIVKEKAIEKPKAAYDDVGLGPYHPFINKETEGKARLDTKAYQMKQALGHTDKPTTTMSRSTFVQVYDRAKKGSKSAAELMDNLGVDLSDENVDPKELYKSMFKGAGE